jgi:hypothetical protein
LYDIFRIIAPEFLTLVIAIIAFFVNQNVNKNNKLRLDSHLFNLNETTNNLLSTHSSSRSLPNRITTDSKLTDPHQPQTISGQSNLNESKNTNLNQTTRVTPARTKLFGNTPGGVKATPVQRLMRIIYPILTQLLFLTILFMCSSLYPSILSVPYVVGFIALILRWSFNYNLIEAKFQLVLKLILLVYSALHILVIYLYQFNLFQLKLNPNSFAIRLVGLPFILSSKCEQPAHFTLNSDIRIEHLIHPFCLVLLYLFIAVEFSYAREKFKQIYFSKTSRETEVTLVGASGASPLAEGTENEEDEYTDEHDAKNDEAFLEHAYDVRNKHSGGLKPSRHYDANDTTVLSDDIMDESEKQVIIFDQHIKLYLIYKKKILQSLNLYFVCTFFFKNNQFFWQIHSLN